MSEERATAVLRPSCPLPDSAPRLSCPPHVASLCSVLQQFVRQDAAAAQHGAVVGAGIRASSLAMTCIFRLLSTGVVVDKPRHAALVQSIVAAGDPGSPDALKLLDLLYSFLKAINRNSQFHTATDKVKWIEAVAEAAAAVFGMALGYTPPSDRAAAPTISCAAVILPRLMLLGRCAAAMAAQAGVASESLPDSSTMGMVSLAGQLTAVAQLLEAGPTAGELSSMGFEPQTLLEQLRGGSASHHAQLLKHAEWCNVLSDARFTQGFLSAMIDRARADGLLAALPDWLQTAGCALTSFAIPHCCNNPDCVNTAGPSEAQLVIGGSNLCGGCRIARYCSRSCLRQHWGQHKPVCKALAVAAAQAGSSGTSVGQTAAS